MADLEKDAEDHMAQLDFEERAPRHLVIHMRGEYDLASTEILEPALGQLLSCDTEAVSIDMSDLEFMDTSGVALLLRIANRFGPVQILEASPLIERCIRSLGLAERLHIPEH